MKRAIVLFLASFLAPLALQAFPFMQAGGGLPASLSISTGVFSYLGVNVTPSGTYRLQVACADINCALFSNSSSNLAIALQAQTNAYIAIDTNRDGGSTQTGQIKFQHNTSEIGHLEGDDAANAIRLDSGSTAQSATGINIDSGHNVGIGAAPTTKLDVVDNTGSVLTLSLRNTINTGQGDAAFRISKSTNGNSAYIAYSSGAVDYWYLGTGISAIDADLKINDNSAGNIASFIRSGATANSFYVKASSVALSNTAVPAKFSISANNATYGIDASTSSGATTATLGTASPATTAAVFSWVSGKLCNAAGASCTTIYFPVWK